MKQWYKMITGEDVGDAESGPIINTWTVYFKAKTMQKAKERAYKLYIYSTGDGYTVEKATEEDTPEILEQAKWMQLDPPF